MSARALVAAVLMLGALSLASAQTRPNIPANQLPGHERERFIDPFPQRAVPDAVVPPQGKRKRRCAPRGTRRAARSC